MSCHDAAVTLSDEDGEGLETAPGNSGWPLVRVLDGVALVLLLVVLARAIGAVVAALDVPGLSFPGGLQGVVGKLTLYSLPTFQRLQLGTGWADISSGILLLVSVAVTALPRLVWSVGPEDRPLSFSPIVLAATGGMSVLAAAAGVVGIVNLFANQISVDNYTQAVNVANSVAGAILGALAAILCWFARPLLQRPTPPPDGP